MDTVTADRPVFIQWKGTDVCMDLRCPCGVQSHVHGEFAYYVRCPGCGVVYEMGSSVSVKPTTEWTFEPLTGEKVS